MWKTSPNIRESLTPFHGLLQQSVRLVFLNLFVTEDQFCMFGLFKLLIHLNSNFYKMQLKQITQKARIQR